MKRILFVSALLGLGLAVSAMSLRSQTSAVAAEVLGTNPSGEFTLLLRLNGSPVFAGHTAPRGDGGTIGRVDGGLGNIVKTQCYSAACVCPGTSCSCGNIASSSGFNVATNGELLAANGINYTVLAPDNGMVTTAAASGSLLLDGGPGAECDHWRL